MNKRNDSTIQILVVLALFGALTACELPKYTGGTPTPSPTSIPEQTKVFLSENGERHFYTNETDYKKGDGWSFWIYCSKVSETMDTIEAECYKTSGDSGAGYGVIFSVNDNNHFLVVLIDTKGNYLVGKRTGPDEKDFITIQYWSAPIASQILPGYGSANKIKVAYNAVTKHYEISFNGEYETEFEDKSDTLDAVGAFGYIVTVSRDEQYPTIGTDVYFKQIIPLNTGL